MKKTIIVLAAIITCTFAANAQIVTDTTDASYNTAEELLDSDYDEDDVFYFTPQYDLIKQYYADKKSAYYYPSLLKRFLKGDTNMTLDDVHFLYYGSVFQDWYNPYGGNGSLESQATDILNSEPLTKKDAKKAYKMLTNAISKNPTDLDLYLYRYLAALSCYGENSKQCQQDVFRFTMLVYVIINSGSGQTMEHAFHVISPSHSYSIMSIMGLSPTDQSLQMDDAGNAYDAFSLGDNDSGIETLYFNVTQAFNSLNSLFEGIEFDDSVEEPVEEDPTE